MTFSFHVECVQMIEACLVFGVFFLLFCSLFDTACRKGLEFLLVKRQNVIKIEMFPTLHSISISILPGGFSVSFSLKQEHIISMLLYFLHFKYSITLLWLCYSKCKNANFLHLTLFVQNPQDRTIIYLYMLLTECVSNLFSFQCSKLFFFIAKKPQLNFFHTYRDKNIDSLLKFNL